MLMGLAAGAVVLAGNLSAQSVTLTDQGTTVKLSNSLVSATISKSDAKVTIFQVGNSPNLAGSKGFYYTTHTVSGTTDNYISLSSGVGATYSVTVNTPGMVDISIRNPKMGYDATAFPQGMFDVDKHFVMRSGVAGIYTYVIWHHTTSQPTAYRYQQRTSETQTSLTTGLTYAYSGGDTWNIAPDPALLTNEITNAVFELPLNSSYTYPTGQYYRPSWPLFYTPNPKEMIGFNWNGNPVWTKYDWAVYSGPETSSLNTFGVANDQYGVWMLNGSQEYLNGGPTKLRGAVQGGAMDINTDESHGIGDSPDQPIPAGTAWEKIYGPYLIYANAGSDHTSLYADAKTKGAAEVAAWPYSWLAVSESLYPRHRGTLTGTLSIPGASAANAQIIVTDPGVDWIFQGANNYIFSTRADSQGRFTLSKLRPHTYTVYAYVPGVPGQMQVDNVTVNADSTTDMGTVTWNAPHQQQLLWRLGTPDRSAGEFRYGNLPRQFGLWFRYLDEHGTGDLDYTIGTSSPANDWYYAQQVTPLPDGTYNAPKWNIHFNLASIPQGPVTLTVALAGASGSGAFHAYVNGTDVSTDTVHGIYTIDDNSIYRDATTIGQFQDYSMSFDPSLLKVGANTVTLTVRKTGSSTWTGTRPVLPGYSQMYDFIQLEAGPAAAGTTLMNVLGGAATTSANSTLISAAVAFPKGEPPTGGIKFSVNGSSPFPAQCLTNDSVRTCRTIYPTTGLKAGTYPVTVSMEGDAHYPAMTNAGTLTVSTPSKTTLAIEVPPQTVPGSNVSVTYYVNSIAGHLPYSMKHSGAMGGEDNNAVCTPDSATTGHCVVSFGKLAPGTYTFQANASFDLDHYYEDSAATGTVTVTP